MFWSFIIMFQWNYDNLHAKWPQCFNVNDRIKNANVCDSHFLFFFVEHLENVIQSLLDWSPHHSFYWCARQDCFSNIQNEICNGREKQKGQRKLKRRERKYFKIFCKVFRESGQKKDKRERWKIDNVFYKNSEKIDEWEEREREKKKRYCVFVWVVCIEKKREARSVERERV